MIDLHIHSHFSDGTLPPATLVKMAEEKGLSAIALCDHNTVAGLPEFLTAGSSSTVETVPGAELTAGYRGQELHILALFIPTSGYAAVTEKMAPYRKAKVESNRRMFQSLEAAGLQLDEDRILKGSLDYVNRMAFAQEITRCGYAANIDEAFLKYLQPGLGFYVPAPRIDALEILHFIRSIGALPVLAHPLHSVSGEFLTEFLPIAKEAGLAAIETRYSKYDPQKTALAQHLADRFGLLESGGSDYHGSSTSAIDIGTGKGNLQIPLTILENLKKAL